MFTKKRKKKRKREELWNNFLVWRKGVINCYWLLQYEIIFRRKEELRSFSMFHAESKDDKKSDYVSHAYDLLLKVTWTVGVRASVAVVAKIMPFCHTKSLLYYFTTSFYNISFIRCSIFLPFHLNIISLFFLILILFFLYYLFLPVIFVPKQSYFQIFS